MQENSQIQENLKNQFNEQTFRNNEEKQYLNQQDEILKQKDQFINQLQEQLRLKDLLIQSITENQKLLKEQIKSKDDQIMNLQVQNQNQANQIIIRDQSIQIVQKNFMDQLQIQNEINSKKILAQIQQEFNTINTQKSNENLHIKHHDLDISVQNKNQNELTVDNDKQQLKIMQNIQNECQIIIQGACWILNRNTPLNNFDQIFQKIRDHKIHHISIDYSFSKMNQSGIELLAQQIKLSPQINHLEIFLSMNEINDEGAILLFDAIDSSSSLKNLEIHLQRNKINQTTIQTITQKYQNKKQFKIYF